MLTIVGVTAMQSTTLEEKMAGNQRDRSVAFQAAETALRDGEAYILATATPAFDANCTGGLCTTASTSIPDWTTYTWSDSKYIAFGTSPSPAASMSPVPLIPNVFQQPRYFIVDLGFVIPMPICSGGLARGYRIIGHGWGQNFNTQVNLETIYAKC